MKKKITTTGDLREMLAEATIDVLSGELDISKALAMHKLAKEVTQSLYEETKIAVMSHNIGNKVYKNGTLPLYEKETK